MTGRVTRLGFGPLHRYERVLRSRQRPELTDACDTARRDEADRQKILIALRYL